METPPCGTATSDFWSHAESESSLRPQALCPPSPLPASPLHLLPSLHSPSRLTGHVAAPPAARDAPSRPRAFALDAPSAWKYLPGELQSSLTHLLQSSVTSLVRPCRAPCLKAPASTPKPPSPLHALPPSDTVSVFVYLCTVCHLQQNGNPSSAEAFVSFHCLSSVQPQLQVCPCSMAGPVTQ